MIRQILTAVLSLTLCSAMAWGQDLELKQTKKKQAPGTSATDDMKVVQPVGVAEAQRGRGKLFVKENTWDFGHVAQNTRVTHSFDIQNVGDDTLFIERIKPT